MGQLWVQLWVLSFKEIFVFFFFSVKKEGLKKILFEFGGASPDGSQDSFLPLCLGVTIGRTQGTRWVPEIDLGELQNKHPTHCVIALAPPRTNVK